MLRGNLYRLPLPSPGEACLDQVLAVAHRGLPPHHLIRALESWQVPPSIRNG